MLAALQRLAAHRGIETNQQRRFEMCEKRHDDVEAGIWNLTTAYCADENLPRMLASRERSNFVVRVKNAFEETELPSDLLAHPWLRARWRRSQFCCASGNCAENLAAGLPPIIRRAASG